MLDPVGQKAANIASGELFAGCKRGRCKDLGACTFWPVSPRACGQLGFLNGFFPNATVYESDPDDDIYGGNSKDGDSLIDAAPFSPLAMGIQGTNADHLRQIPLDLRTRGTEVHIETPWCRWFGAPIRVLPDATHPDEVNFCTFRPTSGDRISVVGDWVIDQENGGEGWSELHEARFLVAVRADQRGLDFGTLSECQTDQKNRITQGTSATRCTSPDVPGCGNPNVWHLLANGFFVRDTAQQNELVVNVPIPPAVQTPGGGPLTRLVADIAPLDSASPGCPATVADAERMSSVQCDDTAGTCRIVVSRMDREDLLSSHECGAEAACPCVNQPSAQQANVCLAGENWSAQAVDRLSRPPVFNQFDACNPGAPQDQSVGIRSRSVIAFARDVRVEWKDPLDSWICRCFQDDPSASGAVIPALVQGCVTHGFQPDDQEEVNEACDEVCNRPRICSGDPECRIGEGRSRDPSFGFRQAENACEEASVASRPSRSGDYRVEIDRTNSLVRVGVVELNGNFRELANTHVLGFAFANIDGPQLTIADLEVQLDPMALRDGLVNVGLGRMRAFSLARATATQVMGAPSDFVLGPAHLKLGASADVDGETGGLTILNRTQAEIHFDSALGTFSLDTTGSDGYGHEVRVHLVGVIVNRPPVARAQVFAAGTPVSSAAECTSPSGVTLQFDATGSTDPDVDDSIAHYQWFDGTEGLGNTPVVEVQAGFGSHTIDLHVYDAKLGSANEQRAIEVIDSTPPTLSLAAGWCLWPPNHVFARFTLGQDFFPNVADACDIAPVVRIVDVHSDEGALQAGSGNTSPDVMFGPTTACVRSERTGTGVGRTYSVTIEATDTHGNAVRRVVPLTVPHDMSGQQGCVRVSGIDRLDAQECQR